MIVLRHCNKRLEKINLKEKRLILAHSVKVSVHGHLTPLFLGLWQAEHDGEGVTKQSCSLLGIREAESVRERDWGQKYFLQGHA